MTESQARTVDSLCKIVATIALVVGGSWTLFVFLDGRHVAAQTAAIEARKPFLAKRLEAYSGLAILASGMENTSYDIAYLVGYKKDPSDLMQLQKNRLHELWELTDGLLDLVGDQEVKKQAMILIRCAEERQTLKQTYSCGLADIRFDLIAACRNSIGKEWQVTIAGAAITKEELEKLRQ